MPRIREGDKYYSEDEFKIYKQKQSETAVILLFLLYGGFGGYSIASYYGLEKTWVFISIFSLAIISSFIVSFLAKYIIYLIKILIAITVLIAIGYIIWVNI